MPSATRNVNTGSIFHMLKVWTLKIYFLYHHRSVSKTFIHKTSFCSARCCITRRCIYKPHKSFTRCQLQSCPIRTLVTRSSSVLPRWHPRCVSIELAFIACFHDFSVFRSDFDFSPPNRPMIKIKWKINSTKQPQTDKARAKPTKNAFSCYK